ncbi:MAG: alkylhydroperoxidase family enzyme [Chlamydiales bacterium]|jgi:alkylhydroperoxidase family enzyme
MTWIQTIGVAQATGRLRKTYDAAIGRAGRVFGIVRTMSLAPPILDASMGLYQRVMYAPEGITRRQREMLAVVVSRANDCHY